MTDKYNKKENLQSVFSRLIWPNDFTFVITFPFYALFFFDHHDYFAFIYPEKIIFFFLISLLFFANFGVKNDKNLFDAMISVMRMLARNSVILLFLIFLGAGLSFIISLIIISLFLLFLLI